MSSTTAQALSALLRESLSMSSDGLCSSLMRSWISEGSIAARCTQLASAFPLAQELKSVVSCCVHHLARAALSTRTEVRGEFASAPTGKHLHLEQETKSVVSSLVGLLWSTKHMQLRAKHTYTIIVTKKLSSHVQSAPLLCCTKNTKLHNWSVVEHILKKLSLVHTKCTLREMQTMEKQSCLHRAQKMHNTHVTTSCACATAEHTANAKQMHKQKQRQHICKDNG